MATAVRFTLSGPTNVDFDEEEIQDVIVPWDQDIQVQKNQTMPPYIFTDGEQWATIIIYFFEKYDSTKTRIDQIIDAEEEMTLYYAYKSFPSKTCSVIYYPDGMTHTYQYHVGGEQAYGVIHKLTFLKSS